ncbi:AN1like Zinc finger domain containing protein [Acanthamoeba castellanii str. Neff]|uniref:AN1like Zinc finger domain containing protein n=1 Tax=Acanthamoeba castellanii (strain ATCC 30010 / Neff) TaxID=1257118 RepID=L8H0Q5_ACACF|nr:AN1like Zinc finger domain containing protein [Acanthamoeba castellanii str. Neff]ELR18802.1 AN1like Zinc finger domain containing protein [Acanthamoeba castellanii str. Neff]
MEEELRFEDDQRDQPGPNPGPYDLLDQRAADILNFPNMLNFGPCRRTLGWPFQRSVRLMLLPPLPYPIAGFTYCSTPLTPTTSPADGADVAAGQAPLPPGHSFLLSGEVSSEGTAEAMYIHKIGKRWSFKNLIVSSLTPSVPIFLSSMKYSGSATTSRFTYTTDKHIFLLNNLSAITTNWALGAELLYSVAEAKPSLSVGLRYLKREGSTSDATTEFTIAAARKKTKRCSVKRCRKTELLPIQCAKCSHQYCLGHRLPSDHNCDVVRRETMTAAHMLRRSTNNARGASSSGGLLSFLTGKA